MFNSSRVRVVRKVLGENPYYLSNLVLTVLNSDELELQILKLRQVLVDKKKTEAVFVVK